MDVSRASPFSFARFLPYSRSGFSVVVLCRVSCPFPVFFRTYGLYTKPVAVVHEASRKIQVENKNNRSARKHKRQTPRKHRRLASKRLKEIQRDLKDSRNLKGCREIYKFSIGSKGLKGIRKDLQRFTEIEKDMKGDLKRLKGLKGV